MGTSVFCIALLDGLGDQRSRCTRTSERAGTHRFRSQQEALTTLAAGFKKYLEYDPDAKLNLSGFADERGANDYNQLLSERRVQRVREFLDLPGHPGEQT